MNKAFEKILEQLEELQNNLLSQTEGDVSVQVGIINGVMYSKKIVQEVAEEYNGGWIACSERLPEIDGNTSDIVLVCGSNGFQYMAFWCDDLKWRFCECGMAKETVLWTEIVAWQPLPQPFQKGDNNENS